VVVWVTDDTVLEEDETFVGLLKTSNSTPDNVFLGDPSMAVGTIIDDDNLSKTIVQLENLQLYIALILNSAHTIINLKVH